MYNSAVDSFFAQNVSNSAVSGECSVEHLTLSLFTKLSLIVLAILFFAGVDYLAWILLSRRASQCNSLTQSQMGDNVSSVGSTLHTMIVCPSCYIAMRRTSWGPNYEPLGATFFMDFVLIISLAYFSVDFFVVSKFGIPHRNIFLVHHCIALYPLTMYLFRPCSVKALYIIGCFILLEVTNAPFNILSYMRQIGDTKSTVYTVVLYLNASLWVVFRLINPLWCIICTHMYILPGAQQDDHCLWLSILCEYVVLIFCYVVFVTELGQEIVKRWTKSKGNVDALMKKDEL